MKEFKGKLSFKTEKINVKMYLCALFVICILVCSQYVYQTMCVVCVWCDIKNSVSLTGSLKTCEIREETP